MNEMLSLITVITETGWLYLSLVLVVAVGLILFDRRRTDAAAETQGRARGRQAA